MAKIVFCEDEEHIQKLIHVMLRATSHEVHFASDGLEGFDLIEREHPDIIFTDVSMPRLDGFQLLARLKAAPPLAHIPVVFMTAFAQRTEIEEGYQQGAISYMSKPFSLNDLRSTIDSLLSTPC